jgi:hypothetical protein
MEGIDKMTASRTRHCKSRAKSAIAGSNTPSNDCIHGASKLSRLRMLRRTSTTSSRKNMSSSGDSVVLDAASPSPGASSMHATETAAARNNTKKASVSFSQDEVREQHRTSHGRGRVLREGREQRQQIARKDIILDYLDVAGNVLRRRRAHFGFAVL